MKVLVLESHLWPAANRLLCPDRAPVRSRRCTRLRETCTYRKRRSRAYRPQAPRPVSLGSASDPSVQAPSRLPAGRGVSAARQQRGRMSLKRSVCCRGRARTYTQYGASRRKRSCWPQPQNLFLCTQNSSGSYY